MQLLSPLFINSDKTEELLQDVQAQSCVTCIDLQSEKTDRDWSQVFFTGGLQLAEQSAMP